MKLPKMTMLLAMIAMLHGCSTTQCPIEPVAESPLGGDEMLGLISGYSESMVNLTQARWSPFLCRVDMVGFEESQAKTDQAHGRKLYYLFSSHAQAYFDIALDKLDEAPVGMTLVKESRKPRLRTEEDLVRGVMDEDGQRWVPGEQAGLFVMHRLDPQTPDTDDGWVYATTNPDGSEIIELGMIESCMACHTQAPRGRLFGVVAPADDRLPLYLVPKSKQ